MSVDRQWSAAVGRDERKERGVRGGREAHACAAVRILAPNPKPNASPTHQRGTGTRGSRRGEGRWERRGEGRGNSGRANRRQKKKREAVAQQHLQHSLPPLRMHQCLHPPLRVRVWRRGVGGGWLVHAGSAEWASVLF